jgi:hypothetical protein
MIALEGRRKQRRLSFGHHINVVHKNVGIIQYGIISA